MRNWIVVLVMLVSQLGAEDKRTAMPAESAIAAQVTIIRDTYKKEYATKKIDELAILAQQLSSLSANLADPVERVAMLREAMSVAGRAGDLTTGVACLESLLKGFSTNQHDERVRFWSGMQIQNPEHAGPAIGSLLSAVDAAILDDVYPAAGKLAAVADQLARRFKLAGELPRTKEAVEQAKYLGVEFEKLSSLSSGDLLGELSPEQHTATGRFYCLAKGDWERGLSHLVAGSDATLKALAEADVAAAKATENIAASTEAAGEAWVEWSRKQLPKPRAMATARARTLLHKAVEVATGLTKVRLEKRLQALGDSGANVSSSSVSTVGLRLWYRADQGVTKDQEGKVSKWQDQSNQGLHAVQSQAALQPLAMQLNGRSMVRFDGKDDCLAFQCDINGLEGMTIAVVSGVTQAVDVGRHANECAAIWWGQTDGWGNTLITAQAGKVAFRFGTGQSDNFCIFTRPQPLPMGDLTLSLAIHDGARSTDHLFVNGTKVFTKPGQAKTTANNSKTGYLGRGEYDTYLSGMVAEVLVYGVALDEPQRVQVETYLRAKYLRGNN
jgi:Concanavalin A-like lectin/glucanases superfamily